MTSAMCHPNRVRNGMLSSTDLERSQLLLELGHEHARADPAELAVIGCRYRIFGQRLRDCAEVIALENLLADVPQSLLDGGSSSRISFGVISMWRTSI